jgi:23S rRNA (pseudouridine1915-N3)-methyltransferase
MYIRILWAGKTKSAPIRSLLAEYTERLKHLLPCSVVELPDLSKRKGLRGLDLKEAEAKVMSGSLSAGSRKVALDECGMELSSTGFARWFESEMSRGTKGIEFMIGGPDGLDSDLLNRADLRLSLGKMTWTHEMCRALLLEQIYRAQCILKNIPYHK